MEMNIPKTKEQKDFETDLQYLIQILAELTKKERTQVVDFAVFLANN